MKVYALLSWYDEDPAHLERCISSLAGFADVVVAVDGAYATFPDGPPGSSHAEHTAIYRAAGQANLRVGMHYANERWPSEVAKRAGMFKFARQCGATLDDWFLIVDGDMAIGELRPAVARERLANTNVDVGMVGWSDIQIDGKACSWLTFRSLFRALPGLTVERAHYIYTVPTDEGRRFLWHLPNGHISPEPALDLTDCLTLHHFNSHRATDRRRRALDYYKDRDARALEAVGDWKK